MEEVPNKPRKVFLSIVGAIVWPRIEIIGSDEF